MSHRSDYRRLLLHCYRSGRSATEAQRELPSSMGLDAPSLGACYRWFKRFDEGDFSMEESPRSGRPRSSNSDTVLACVRDNPMQSLRGMVRATSTLYSTIRSILTNHGYRAKRPGLVMMSLTDA
ncbi:unnamed protein product [Nippostrongylus brasiliensis]|uniref:HTH_48 domain-containing protein n=1 Tax=Nippostrongylus brasiliensis TaxID=27835 RepID=A0A0N4Y0X7_NIPBR|nr:unnamed protein product [Nippostrongylus brasiliensis]